ncbi:hypothetical protein J7F03_25070 [Streptomyces sp. ISL-43]|uniref:hypothetical protein n=1 Tax=Streptomyces sp. ISL-43 TaxID=2819183 RepID=UPI001BE7309E|nr:hypothetical protein [Streptomyces sp. ISL-43]MBT2450288.1 hypothetical protein [Streptomyces sp. ISL-43]
MVDLRDLIYDMLGLLFTELSQHGGMAGDDGAGRVFAAVYKPAVATVFASAGHAHQAMANGAGTLLKAAEDFIRQDNAIAAALLDQSPAAPGIGSQPSGPDCNPRASHKAEDLPEVVGETSWTDQYLLDKRFHGQRDKLRKTATVWNSAAKILEDAWGAVDRGAALKGRESPLLPSRLGGFSMERRRRAVTAAPTGRSGSGLQLAGSWRDRRV